MSKFLDEDDVIDYANDDYDEEDEITPEDDAKITSLIPSVKKQLAEYEGITFDIMYDEIWNCYLDPDEAVKNLKKKHKKKQQKQKEKESKLAMLAKRKQATVQSEAKLKSVSILDSLDLKKTLNTNTINSDKAITTSTAAQDKPPTTKPVAKLSKLASLRAKKDRINDDSKISNTSESNIRRPGLANLRHKAESNRIFDKDKNTVGVPRSSQSVKEIRKTSEFEEILSTLVFCSKSNLLLSKSKFISFADDGDDAKSPLIQELSSYSQYLYSPFYPVNSVNFNTNETVKTATKNFSKPSKDDVILSAQAQAVNPKKDEVAKITTKLDDLDLKRPSATKPKKSLDLQKANANHKPNLSFAVVGHIDAGKSTLMGMLLKQLNKVDKNFLKKLEDESVRIGKKSFALAWIMDQTSSERSKGITIDICTTSVDTEKANFVIIDAPGHKDFVPKMIAGVAQADIALLIIDAQVNAFESSFSYDGQTREHAIICQYLGMKKLVIVVNKMDLVNYSEARYNDIKTRLSSHLIEEVGFKAEQLQFVPVSGFVGVNVTKKPTEPLLNAWYKPENPTLLEILQNDAIELSHTGRAAIDVSKENFNFQIFDVDTSFHQSSEFSIVGRVNSGAIQAGETICVSPGNIFLPIEEIKVLESTNDKKQVEKYVNKDYAVKFDNNVSLFFKDRKVKDEIKSNVDYIRSGDIITKLDSPIEGTTKFTCEIELAKTGTHSILVGTKLMLYSIGNERPVEVAKLISLLNKDGTVKKKKRLMHIPLGQSAIIEVQLIDESSSNPRPLALTPFKENQSLGRVIFRKSGYTVGVGKVLETQLEDE